ncbi:hypothetical protein ACN4EE_20715 [Geminocystis sp. CENA526]|uniref:hypothetical protein n=1 Tax=Geminocystis sp. CENA526 TaxID=1355871 RepID=UPI003D6EC788
MLIDKIIEELHQIPSENLTQIYELVHQMCLEINQENEQPRTSGLLQGKLGEAFFEQLPEEELQQWETDI